MVVDETAQLPEFELDCSDWIVSRPEEVETDEAPVLAVLSTMVIDDDVREATGSITVGLLECADDLADLAPRPVCPGAAAQEVLDHDPQPGTRRYVVPAPGGPIDAPRLALVAEFTVPHDAAAELDRRVHALMGSFRWRAA